ncbi:MAG: hypothetical protein K2K70_03415 [Lachnospiraceae bacterium]|nr:hypothetical protein [Lachnospiraceae bacterium]
MLFHNICFECKAAFGRRNPDRLFYVIRCPQAEMGLYAVINYVTYHLNMADSIGAEPVVDWQYYPNKYFSEDDKIGKENAWEYFFLQTTDVSVDEVYKSRNVIMSSGEWEVPGEEWADPEKVWDNHNIVEKYIKLNKKTEAMYLMECERLKIGTEKVLGLKCRGTDFIVTKPKGHAIVPDNELLIRTIESKMDEWGEFDKIYLSTEDENIQNKLKEYFGEKLYYTEGKRFSLNKNCWLGDIYDKERERVGTKEDDMRNYIISTYILGACDSLIGAQVGGTLGAMRIRGRYEHIHIFRLGLY